MILRTSRAALFSVLALFTGCQNMAPSIGAPPPEMTDPQVSARAADALRASDLVTQDTAQTLAGIDLAIWCLNRNIQNAQSTGFKRIAAVGVEGKPWAMQLDLDQGALYQTKRSLDLGLSGDGFFAISWKGTTAYTRDGHLFLDRDRQLVTSQGYRIEPPIAFPAHNSHIMVSEDGSVTCKTADNEKQTLVGRLHLYRFDHPSGLSLNDEGLFFPTDRSGHAIEEKPQEAGSVSVLQEFLEASNVNVYREKLRLKLLRNWRAEMLQSIEPKAH